MCAFSRISCKFAIRSTFDISQFTNSIDEHQQNPLSVHHQLFVNNWCIPIVGSW